MAQVPSPYTLLVAVRSQLSLDSDSESSTPEIAAHDNKPTTDDQPKSKASSDAPTEPQPSLGTHAPEQTSSFSSGSTCITCTLHGSDCDCEPTPKAPTFLDSSFSSASTLPTETITQNTSFATNNGSFSTNNASFTTAGTEPFPEYDETDLEAYTQAEAAYQTAFTAAMTEHIRIEKVDPFLDDTTHLTLSEAKADAMETLKQHLSHPHLHAKTRERFISMTNMIVRLEAVLFRSEEEFLSPAMVKEAEVVANVLLGYAAWVDGVMEEMLVVTRPVRHFLGQMMAENVAEVLRYRNMAGVVAGNLKKPRGPEQKLLAAFADTYDKWVHDKFLALRNRQILAEETLEPNRLQLTRVLHAIWEILERAVEAYAAYRAVLVEIRDKYFRSMPGAVEGMLQILERDLSVVIEQ